MNGIKWRAPLSDPVPQSSATLNTKSILGSPIDHMLSILAKRNVYLVTPWKIYIYYIDTEYKWGILSGILWLCRKTNCHICLSSCFTIPILQSPSTCLYSEVFLFPKPFLYQHEAHAHFSTFLCWKWPQQPCHLPYIPVSWDIPISSNSNKLSPCNIIDLLKINQWC